MNETGNWDPALAAIREERLMEAFEKGNVWGSPVAEPWRLRLRPGDVLVLTTKRLLTADETKNLKERALGLLTEAGLSGIGLLVIDGGVMLGVLSKEEING